MAQLKSTVVQGALTVTGNVVANKLIKLGGTSDEILMADGTTATLSELGAGTVTSVGIVNGGGLSVTGSPITGAGTITISHADTSSQGSMTTGGRTYVNSITLDAYGHVTAIGTGTESNQDLSNYVTGPNSSTDNAVARFDEATGKIIQNSSATLDDDGNLKITGNLYVPAQKYAYFGTNKLATFRANDNGAFIVGAYDDIYFRGNLDSNDSAQATGIQLSKTYLKPEVTNTMALGASDKAWSNVYSKQLTSTVATGTAPLVVTSTTVVANLNADMLDGKHASSFQAAGNYVTIDTTQTITGNKTFTGNVVTSNNKFEIKASSNTDDSWIKLTNATDAGYYAFGIRRPYDTYGLQLKIHPASGTDTYYNIWHAGNDGSGSGLDADLLDGKHASAFALTSDIPADYIKITLSGNSGTLTAEQHAAMLANPHKVVFNRGSIWYYAENLGSTYFYTGQNVIYSGSKIQKHVLGINPNSANRTWTYTLYEYDPGVGDATITLTAGKGLTGGESFTTNQGTAETITFNVGAGTGISVTDDAVALAAYGAAGTYGPTSNATLSHSGTFTVPKVVTDAYGRVTAANITYTLPADNDTKNTAGSTNSDSKLFLIGATSQTTNPQTYSDSEVYTTNGTLTTAKVQVGGGTTTLQYNSTEGCLEFVFA